MTCVLCRKKIKVESEDFEEVGKVEFAHVECRDKAEGLNARAEDQD